MSGLHKRGFFISVTAVIVLIAVIGTLMVLYAGERERSLFEGDIIHNRVIIRHIEYIENTYFPLFLSQSYKRSWVAYQGILDFDLIKQNLTQTAINQWNTSIALASLSGSPQMTVFNVTIHDIGHHDAFHVWINTSLQYNFSSGTVEMWNATLFHTLIIDINGFPHNATDRIRRVFWTINSTGECYLGKITTYDCNDDHKIRLFE